MCWKVDELCRALTADELGALETLARAKGPAGGKAGGKAGGEAGGEAGAGRDMPFALLQRLLNLGLVELCCGGLDLTAAGRLALASMQAHEPRYGEAGAA